MSETIAGITPAPAYVSLNVAADYLGCTGRTITRYVHDGRLPAYRLGPRNLRFRITDLEALITPADAA